MTSDHEVAEDDQTEVPGASLDTPGASLDAPDASQDARHASKMAKKKAARDRMMATRQLRSLAPVGFLFGDFIPPEIAVAERDCESTGTPPAWRGGAP